MDKALQQGADSSIFGQQDNQQWLEEVTPLYADGRMAGAMVILEDANAIHAEGVVLWWHSFWHTAAFVSADRLRDAVDGALVPDAAHDGGKRIGLRRLRMGQPAEDADDNLEGMSLFAPLAREVESMAESLILARAAAESEARLRDAGEHQWTAERLAANIRERFGSSRIFLLSNREPYMHVLQGKETVCMVPPSGLVTALEPVLRACDGVWVAHGSGSEDALNVDKFDRLRVPPDDPRYTLRRVWLSKEEEAGYYDGFANEGPVAALSHCAHPAHLSRFGLGMVPACQ